MYYVRLKDNQGKYLWIKNGHPISYVHVEWAATKFTLDQAQKMMDYIWRYRPRWVLWTESAS